MTPAELRYRTAEFARRVGQHVRPLLQDPGPRSAAAQLIRASQSVAANYRAACLARSHTEFLAIIGLVLTETDESLFWLEHLDEPGPRMIPMRKELVREAGELAKIFGASYRTARSHRDLGKRSRR